MTSERVKVLSGRLAALHLDTPFRPSAPREAARRVLEVVRAEGLDGQIVRGGVDVGAAEIDHLWVRVQDQVIDVSLPLYADRFVTVLRAWVAGDVDDTELDTEAVPFGIERRVIATVPGWCAYRGRPILSHRGVLGGEHDADATTKGNAR